MNTTRAHQVASSKTPSPHAGAGHARRQVGTPLPNRVMTATIERALRSGERPLDPATRREMEQRFGHNLSDVRVHVGGDASAAASRVETRAFAVGPHIVFGDGAFDPGTARGRRLIAHELTHVIQQKHARDEHPLVMPVRDGSLERQARRAADNAIAGHDVGAIQPVSAQIIQREETEDTEPRDESLGPFEAGAIKGIAAGVSIAAPSLKPLFEGLFSGFYTEVRHQTKKGKLAEFGDRYWQLLKSPSEMLEYGKGFVWGFVQGLWSPIQGLVDLVKLGVKVQEMEISAITTVIQHPDEVVAMKDRLVQKFAKLGARAGELWAAFKEHPIDSALRLLQAASEGMFELGKKGGAKAGRELFKFLKKPWREIGETIGKIDGTIVIEAALAFFTEGIGNALSKVGQALDKIAPTLMKGIRFIATEIGSIVNELKTVIQTIKDGLAKAGRSLLKGVEDFVGEAGGAFDELVAFLKRLFTGAEEAAEKVHPPTPHAPAPHAPAPHTPAAKPKPRSSAVTNPEAQLKKMSPDERRAVEGVMEKAERQQAARATGELQGEQARAGTQRTRQSENARHRSQFVDEKGRPRTAGHHGFPQYLGGKYEQELLKLEEDLHYLYHQELDLRLGIARKRGTKFYKGLPKEEMDKLLGRVIDHAKEFDGRYKTKIADALMKGMEEAEPGRVARALATPREPLPPLKPHRPVGEPPTPATQGGPRVATEGGEPAPAGGDELLDDVEDAEDAAEEALRMGGR